MIDLIAQLTLIIGVLVAELAIVTTCRDHGAGALALYRDMRRVDTASAPSAPDAPGRQLSGTRVPVVGLSSRPAGVGGRPAAMRVAA